MERVHVVRVWRKEGRPAHSRAERGGSGRRRGLDGGGGCDAVRVAGRGRYVSRRKQSLWMNHMLVDASRRRTNVSPKERALLPSYSTWPVAVMSSVAQTGSTVGGLTVCAGANGEGKCGLGVLFGRGVAATN